jgi:hypothetical protein
MIDLIKLNWKENYFPEESICDTMIKIIVIIVVECTFQISGVRNCT